MTLELDMKSFEGFEELSAEEMYAVDGGTTAAQAPGHYPNVPVWLDYLLIFISGPCQTTPWYLK
jgi:hypothetical protein